MKRISTIILALLMLLTSCGAPGDTTETTPETADVPAAEETAAETELTANLPDANYEGYTVTYLTCENYVNNFKLITELTGESLNDAAFNRNLRIRSQIANGELCAIGNGQLFDQRITRNGKGDILSQLHRSQFGIIDHDRSGISLIRRQIFD